MALCNCTNKYIGRGLTKIWSSDSVLNSIHSTSGSGYLSFDQHLTVWFYIMIVYREKQTEEKFYKVKVHVFRSVLNFNMLPFVYICIIAYFNDKIKFANFKLEPQFIF